MSNEYKENSINKAHVEEDEDAEGEEKETTTNPHHIPRCLKWIVQILTWFSITGTLWFRNEISELENLPLISTIASLCFVITIYLLFSFKYSETFHFLKNNQQKETIDKYLQGLYKADPKIALVGKCYHIENFYNGKRVKTPKGKKKNIIGLKQKKTFTREVRKDFQIFSSRDISQDFHLTRSKGFVKLTLHLDLNYDDVISQLDYENAKATFWEEYHSKDTEFVLSEEVTLENFHNHNLIKISELNYPCVSLFYYFLFTIPIPVNEIYKLYLSLICEEQEYTISKSFSTRYDLNDVKEESTNPNHQTNSNRVKRIPSVIINNEMIVFVLEDTDVIKKRQSNKFELPPVPTEEELKIAEKRFIKRDSKFKVKRVSTEKNWLPNLQVVENENEEPKTDDGNVGVGLKEVLL